MGYGRTPRRWRRLPGCWPPAGVEEPDKRVREILKIISMRIRGVMKDEGCPNREKYITDLVAELMADEVLKSFFVK